MATKSLARRAKMLRNKQKEKRNTDKKYLDMVQNALEDTLMTRAALMKSSQLDTEKRDINYECGYPKTITIDQYHEMYEREGIATRVVNVYPEECWTMEPDILETEDTDPTEFEDAWMDLVNKKNILHYLARLDTMSGIGHFGVMLLGIGDGKKLDQPVKGLNLKTGEPDPDSIVEPVKLNYLRVFPQRYVGVHEWEKDQASPMYGFPKIYKIKFSTVEGLSAGMDVPNDLTEHHVHWTRVLHVADNPESSEIFGAPRMRPVYNRLIDLRKLLGGSAEMFWKGAFPGLAFTTMPDLGDSILDKDSLRDEFSAYMEGLQRYIATSGVDVKSLAPQVASPNDHITMQLQALSATIGTPMRILLGTEAAELASTQDKQTWNNRVKKRQRHHLTPRILYPFIYRCQAIGILPPVENFRAYWPDLDTPTDIDRADVLLKTVEAMARFVQGGVHTIMDPRDFFVNQMNFHPDLADAVLERASEFQGDDDKVDSMLTVSGNLPAEEPTTGTTNLPQGSHSKADPDQS